jgi:thioredoxin 1
MASEKIVTLTNDNFKDVINGDQPVLVDFWAEWCGPCRMVAPVLDELADSHENVVIGKLNVDENQELAFQYQVQSIPTFVLFQDGEVKDRMMGAMPKQAFQRFLEKNLEKNVA